MNASKRNNTPLAPFDSSNPDALITLHDCETVTRLRRGYLRNLRSKGLFVEPAPHPGRKLLFRLGDVQEWLHSRELRAVTSSIKTLFGALVLAGALWAAPAPCCWMGLLEIPHTHQA